MTGKLELNDEFDWLDVSLSYPDFSLGIIEVEAGVLVLDVDDNCVNGRPSQFPKGTKSN